MVEMWRGGQAFDIDISLTWFEFFCGGCFTFGGEHRIRLSDLLSPATAGGRGRGFFAIVGLVIFACLGRGGLLPHFRWAAPGARGARWLPTGGSPQAI